MTRYILPTDIDLAKGLITSQRPDSAIVAALVLRRVDQADAAQLVADLRNGRQVKPQIPPGIVGGPSRRSHSRRAPRPSETQPSHAAEAALPPKPATAPKARSQRASASATDKPANASTFWLLAAVPVCLVVVVVGVLISNRLHGAGDEDQVTKPQPVTRAENVSSSAAPSASGTPASTNPQSTVRKPESGQQQLPIAGITNASIPQQR